MNYVIAIPSHNRALDINRQTLKMLDYYNIDFKNVFIFVDKTEYHQYNKFLKYPANIIEGSLGIKENRKAISNYFNNNQYIVSIDDDVTHILKLKICQTGKNRLDKCSDLKLFINETIDIVLDRLAFQDLALGQPGGVFGPMPFTEDSKTANTQDMFVSWYRVNTDNTKEYSEDYRISSIVTDSTNDNKFRCRFS